MPSRSQRSRREGQRRVHLQSGKLSVPRSGVAQRHFRGPKRVHFRKDARLLPSRPQQTTIPKCTWRSFGHRRRYVRIHLFFTLSNVELHQIINRNRYHCFASGNYSRASRSAMVA